MRAENIIYAADLDDADQIIGVLDEIRDYIGIVKITPHIVINGGLEKILSYVGVNNPGLFLDVKLHDIPRTVFNAVRAAAGRGVSMLTLHISGGEEMLRAATDARGSSGIKLLGVTKLTSLRATVDEVVEMAGIARKVGLDGVVCSAFESLAVKNACGRDFLVVTPGIRLRGDAVHDQSRVATPRYAMENLADYIVVGRSVTNAVNKAAVMREILSRD